MDPKFYHRLAEIGQVTRYHTAPGPIQQTIAAHSWGVAWIITEFHPKPSVGLIRAALEHDMEEHLTSDMSYYSKALYPPLAEAMEEAARAARQELGIRSLENLSEDDVWWLKLADLLEGVLWSAYLVKAHGCVLYHRPWNNYAAALERHTAKNAPKSFENNFTLKMVIRQLHPRGAQ